MRRKALELQKYYPEESLRITDVIDEPHKITICMRSVTTTCECHECGKKLTHYHGTYVRKVQDLPILGKNVELHITAREYQCDNDKCPASTVAEMYEGFLNPCSRMTERCADFVCTLALETSCEGASRVCQAMDLKISGDTVIRLLTRRYQSQEKIECGAVIGIDDFAFRKRHKYGTIIVDEATHRPVALLDGRDGKTLKEWLESNKHVKTITRDRASAYASAIREILPDAMQIADRFHLHQNLLEAVRNTVNGIVPVDIRIPKEAEVCDETASVTESSEDICKKNG